MNFKEFTTLLKEGIQRLTPDEEAQIAKLTADLWNNWRSLPEEKIKKLKKKAEILNGHSMTLVAEISYGRRDLKTPKAKNKVLDVYLDWDEDLTSKAEFVAHSNSKFDYIKIGFKDLNEAGSKYRLQALLSHELIHAVQHYRKASEGYKIAAEKPVDEMTYADWVNYYSDPTEKEAIFSEIDSYIKLQFNALLPSETTEKTLRNYLNYSRKKYLLELKLFITSPIENYIVNKELPLPPVLQHFEWFLKVLLRRSESLLKIPVNRKTEEKLNKLIRELKEKKLLSTYKDLLKKEEEYQKKNLETSNVKK